jgi:hypothetical protein
MLQSQAGMLPIAKAVIAEMFEKMNKEEIEDLAKRVGKDTVHNIVLFMKVNVVLLRTRHSVLLALLELPHILYFIQHCKFAGRSIVQSLQR